jgi:hypothetical protein
VHYLSDLLQLANDAYPTSLDSEASSFPPARGERPRSGSRRGRPHLLFFFQQRHLTNYPSQQGVEVSSLSDPPPPCWSRSPTHTVGSQLPCFPLWLTRPSTWKASLASNLQCCPPNLLGLGGSLLSICLAVWIRKAKRPGGLSQI